MKPLIHDVLNNSAWTPNPTKEQWDSYNSTGYKGMHSQGYFGQGVKVAVIDTGIYKDHEIFKNSDVIQLSTTYGVGEDDNGHGTHVAGSIARIAPHAQIVSYKVLDFFGTSDSIQQAVKDINEAIDDAIARDVDIISMSLGISESGLKKHLLLDELNSSIIRAQKANIFLCVSAGNDANEADEKYPGAFDGVTTIGAVDETFAPAWFSSVTKHIDFCQVGVDVMSASYFQKDGKDGYVTMTGTSMSQPIAAGIATLLICKYKYIFNVRPVAKELWQMMMMKSIDLHETGFDTKTGVGFLTLKEDINTIEYPINEDVAYINGVPVQIPLGARYLKASDGQLKTVLPTREGFEFLGESIIWTRKKQEDGTYKDTVIVRN